MIQVIRKCKKIFNCKLVVIKRGTRQRCPLSPSLLSLLMEQIAESLCSTHHVKVYQWRNEMNFLPYMVDNRIPFLQGPGPFLCTAVQILNSFCIYSYMWKIPNHSIGPQFRYIFVPSVGQRY